MRAGAVSSYYLFCISAGVLFRARVCAVFPSLLQIKAKIGSRWMCIQLSTLVSVQNSTAMVMQTLLWSWRIKITPPLCSDSLLNVRITRWMHAQTSWTTEWQQIKQIYLQGILDYFWYMLQIRDLRQSQKHLFRVFSHWQGQLYSNPS